MSWTCPKCGKEKQAKGSHEFYCKEKTREEIIKKMDKDKNFVPLQPVRTLSKKEVLVRTEDEIVKDPYAKPQIQPAERKPHNGCPSCGCVETLVKVGQYLEPVQYYRCNLCGKGHQWNEVDDVAI